MSGVTRMWPQGIMNTCIALLASFIWSTRLMVRYAADDVSWGRLRPGALIPKKPCEEPSRADRTPVACSSALGPPLSSHATACLMQHSDQPQPLANTPTKSHRPMVNVTLSGSFGGIGYKGITPQDNHTTAFCLQCTESPNKLL